MTKPSTANQAPTRKVAVDSVASDYWTSYYSETGYGALWVKEIPKRVRAALQLDKTASADSTPALKITPIATVHGADGVTLEAFVTLPDRKVKAVRIDFDNEGNQLSFNAVDVVELAS